MTLRAGINGSKLATELRVGTPLGPVTSVPLTVEPWTRLTPPRKPQPVVPVTPTPSVPATLEARIAAAVKRWRHLSRRSVRRSGFVLTGLEAPSNGQFELFVVGRRTIALGEAEARSGNPARLRAQLTRAGRRLLAKHRRLHLRAVLKFVAQADGHVSRASATLSLPAK